MESKKRRQSADYTVEDLHNLTQRSRWLQARFNDDTCAPGNGATRNLYAIAEPFKADERFEIRRGNNIRY